MRESLISSLFFHAITFFVLLAISLYNANLPAGHIQNIVVAITADLPYI